MQEIIMGETRAEEVRRERRFKPGSVEHSGLKLAIAEEKLDRKGFIYRWVNDMPGRVKRMEALDYDIVKDDIKPDSSGLGSAPTVVVGVDGPQGLNAVLMRKRLDWYEDDQKAKQEKLDELDKAIMRGTVHAQSESDLRGDIAYTPNGRNSITS
jgi:hypothetical protein